VFKCHYVSNDNGSLSLSPLLLYASLVWPILRRGPEPFSLQGVQLAGTSQSKGSSFNKDTSGALAEDARQTASEGGRSVLGMIPHGILSVGVIRTVQPAVFAALGGQDRIVLAHVYQDSPYGVMYYLCCVHFVYKCHYVSNDNCSVSYTLHSGSTPSPLLPYASLVRPILHGGSKPSSFQGVQLAGTSQTKGSSFNEDTSGTLAEDARQTVSEGGHSVLGMILHGILSGGLDGGIGLLLVACLAMATYRVINKPVVSAPFLWFV